MIKNFKQYIVESDEYYISCGDDDDLFFNVFHGKDDKNLSVPVESYMVDYISKALGDDYKVMKDGSNYIIVRDNFGTLVSNIIPLKDEWFLCNVRNKKFVYTTYKCDQLDGLVKLLKDNLLYKLI